MLADITQHSGPSQSRKKMASTRLLHLLVLALEHTTSIAAHTHTHTHESLNSSPAPLFPGLVISRLLFQTTRITHTNQCRCINTAHWLPAHFLLPLQCATSTAVQQRVLSSSISIAPFLKIHQLQGKINSSINYQHPPHHKHTHTHGCVGKSVGGV